MARVPTFITVVAAVLRTLHFIAKNMLTIIIMPNKIENMLFSPLSVFFLNDTMLA